MPWQQNGPSQTCGGDSESDSPGAEDFIKRAHEDDVDIVGLRGGGESRLDARQALGAPRAVDRLGPVADDGHLREDYDACAPLLRALDVANHVHRHLLRRGRLVAGGLRDRHGHGRRRVVVGSQPAGACVGGLQQRLRVHDSKRHIAACWQQRLSHTATRCGMQKHSHLPPRSKSTKSLSPTTSITVSGAGQDQAVRARQA